MVIAGSRRWAGAVALSWVLWGTGGASAQTAAPAQGPTGSLANLPRPTGQAVRVETAPTIDGDVLGDPGWKAAPVIDGFRQEITLTEAAAEDQVFDLEKRLARLTIEVPSGSPAQELFRP